MRRLRGDVEPRNGSVFPNRRRVPEKVPIFEQNQGMNAKPPKRQGKIAKKITVKTLGCILGECTWRLGRLAFSNSVESD
jgi:hypothetical protein